MSERPKVAHSWTFTVSSNNWVCWRGRRGEFEATRFFSDHNPFLSSEARAHVYKKTKVPTIDALSTFPRIPRQQRICLSDLGFCCFTSKLVFPFLKISSSAGFSLITRHHGVSALIIKAAALCRSSLPHRCPPAGCRRDTHVRSLCSSVAQRYFAKTRGVGCYLEHLGTNYDWLPFVLHAPRSPLFSPLVAFSLMDILLTPF